MGTAVDVATATHITNKTYPSLKRPSLFIGDGLLALIPSLETNDYERRFP